MLYNCKYSLIISVDSKKHFLCKSKSFFYLPESCSFLHDEKPKNRDKTFLY